MKFELDEYSFTFENPAQYPSVEPIEKVQAIDRTASGSLQIEDFRVAIKSRTLVFNNMSQNDYDGLRDWFDNVSNGAANAFTFTDEESNSYLVRIVSNVYSFSQDFHQLYSGSLVLEVVQ